jgi:hypothetical protein
MPYANLTIAQAASSFIAAPYLVTLAVPQDDATLGPYLWYIIAAAGALIVWIGGFIGARISRSIYKPTMMTLVSTFVFALIGTFAAIQFLAPRVEAAPGLSELFALTPVVAALVGYMVHRGVAQA